MSVVMDQIELPEVPEHDLAQLLVLEVGRIMEELSFEMAKSLPTEDDKRQLTLDDLGQLLLDAQRILAAARALTSHSPPTTQSST